MQMADLGIEKFLKVKQKNKISHIWDILIYKDKRTITKIRQVESLRKKDLKYDGTVISKNLRGKNDGRK